MSFDPIRWASTTGIPAGRPEPPAPPEPIAGGVVSIDRAAWLALVEATAPLAALEVELRAAGWTLGPLPEDAGTLTVAAALATDASTLAGCGGGFHSRRYDETAGGIRLRIRPAPVAQAGVAIVLPGFARGLEALATLARSAAVPDEALLLDRAATGLWLAAAEAEERVAPLLGSDDALLLLLTQDASGIASDRLQRAAATLVDFGAETLGQELAQAWSAARDRLALAERTLAAAGWHVERRETRRTWADAVAEPRRSGSWVGLEATGIDAQSVLLRARRLSAIA